MSFAIPISNVQRQNMSILPDIMSSIEEVIRSGQYIKGTFVKEFEINFSGYNKADYCVGLNSGTDALYCAVKALGIGPGDKVIVPDMTYLATAEAVKMAGAIPVFVDVDPKTDCIDASLFPEAIATHPEIKAVIAVHMHGYLCDMNAIKAFCYQHSIPIIEDCAQATGAADVTGKKAGTFGDVGCFSFFPTKNLGGIGDGGAIITKRKDVYEYVKTFAGHGCTSRDNPVMVGINSRLDSIQAAILSTKLSMLDEWNAQRYEIARMYSDLLSGIDEGLFILPQMIEGSVFHHYMVRVSRMIRDPLLVEMGKLGIECLPYYGKRVSEMSPYSFDPIRWNEVPNSEMQSKSAFSLPIFPEMGKYEIEYICSSFKKLILED